MVLTQFILDCSSLNLPADTPRCCQWNVFSTGVTSELVCWEWYIIPWYKPRCHEPNSQYKPTFHTLRTDLIWLLFQAWHFGLYWIFWCDILACIFWNSGMSFSAYKPESHVFNMTAPWAGELTTFLPGTVLTLMDLPPLAALCLFFFLFSVCSSLFIKIFVKID